MGTPHGQLGCATADVLLGCMEVAMEDLVQQLTGQWRLMCLLSWPSLVRLNSLAPTHSLPCLMSLPTKAPEQLSSSFE